MRDLTKLLVSNMPKDIHTHQTPPKPSSFLNNSANIVFPTQFLTIRLQISELTSILKALQSPFQSQPIDSAQVELQTR
jgi:hypothetical protein